MSLGFPRLARAGAAAGLAVACLALNAASTSAAANSVRSQEWWLQALHVTQAWHSTRASGVTVAVLDTGVYPNQADLRGAVTTGPDYTHSGRTHGGPFWGIHGTAIASLIAGRGHGASAGAGMMGVAPAASILSVRVTLESNDPLLSDANVGGRLPGAIARGIRYAVNHHASVIDLPLDPVTVPGSPGVGGSGAEKAAVAYALAHHVVLVAPAGDEGAGADPVNFPASYKGVISVGAFDSQFNKASFSSRQPYVTLTGPGVGVIAANGPTGYAQINSTAAASAVVSGVAALIRAQFPTLSPAQVTKALTQSARFGHAGGQQNGSGAGTVDAARALAAAAHMVEAVPSAGSSPVAGAPGAQPPSAPAVHASSHLSRTLLIDVGIAVAIFLLLAVPILTYGLRRRLAGQGRPAGRGARGRPAGAAAQAAVDAACPDRHGRTGSVRLHPGAAQSGIPRRSSPVRRLPAGRLPDRPLGGPVLTRLLLAAPGREDGHQWHRARRPSAVGAVGQRERHPGGRHAGPRHPRERVPRARGPGSPDQPTRAASGPVRPRRLVDTRWPGRADRPGGPGWAGRPGRPGRAPRRG